MRVAQQLYEGVDVGGGTVGLITYMRTDSFSLAAEAIAQIRDYVKEFRCGLPAKNTGSLQNQIQKGAGSARGDLPDRYQSCTGTGAPVSER